MTSTGVASIPMYDPEELHWANDAWWAATARVLRERGISAPAQLSRGDDMAVWRSPELTVSQICGRPLACWALGLTVIGRPHLPRSGGPPGSYASYLVAPAGASDEPCPEGARVAINSWDSHSGWTAFVTAVGLPSDRIAARVITTGSHRRSLALLGAGEVERAAIDCVTFDLAARHRPELVRGLRILGMSQPAAAPPFVVRDPATGPAVLAALREALAGLPAVREALGLEDVLPAGVGDYDDLLALAQRAPAPVACANCGEDCGHREALLLSSPEKTLRGHG